MAYQGKPEETYNEVPVSEIKVGGTDQEENMKADEIYFDYWCPECENYILLEKDKNNILEGQCALCGLKISILYKTWKENNERG